MSSNTTSAAEQTPAGYWRDTEGRLVPESMVKAIDRARDQLVRDLITRAQQQAEALAKFKEATFNDIAAFVELSAEQYGVKVGGKKGNVTLVSFDGRYKLIRQVQDTLAFDERLQVAKELIDSCIHRWTAGSRDEIRALINDAFQVDKEGKISTKRVLGLKRLDIVDPEWQRAMKAIADSVRTAASSTYVRFYERIDDTDQFRPISLDLATI